MMKHHQYQTPFASYQRLSKVDGISKPINFFGGLPKLDLSVPNNDNNSTTKDDEVVFCSTNSRCWEDEIPTEVMAKILSMVPISRLLQYKCVSKTWFNTISHHIDPNLFSVNQEPGFIVIQRQMSVNVFTRLSFNLREGGVKPKSIDSAPLELCFSNSCTYQSSCNGLICLKQYYSKSKCSSSSGYRIIVCNPYLLEATTLPDIINSSSAIPPAQQQQQQQPHVQQLPPNNFEENYGLGFSPPTNQYKVVRLTWFTRDYTDMIYRLSFRKSKRDGSIISYNHYRRPEEIKILTLGGGTTNGKDNKYSSSWRNVSNVPPHPIYGTPVYANGFLYWLVDKRNTKVHYNVKDWNVSFDVEKEKFYITSQPPSSGGGLGHLNNLRGCLAIVLVGVGGINIDVWVLQHLKSNNNYQQQQQQWIREYSLEISHFGNRVIGLWEHGEILCLVHPKTLISYDPKTNKKRYIYVRSGFESTGVSFHVSSGQNEIHGHTGSLVSLKAYGCKTWRIAPGKIHSNLYGHDAMLSKQGVSTTMQLLTTQYISGRPCHYPWRL